MSQKKQLAILFGGKSAEHEISLLSAKNILNAIDRNKYDVFPVGISRSGEWYLQDDHAQLEDLSINADKSRQVSLVNDAGKALLSFVHRQQTPLAIDVTFPVLHGPYGEDGTIQGLLKLADIPFVGSDVIGHAVAMDKDVCKRLLAQAGLPITAHLVFHQHQFDLTCLEKIVQTLGFPCFVKPANMGSSVGISKAIDAASLQTAIDLAFEYDHKILVEQGLAIRDLECAVLGNNPYRATLPCEIIPEQEFYDYNAKYVDDNTQYILPAKLSKETIEEIQQLSMQACEALSCQGFARVDLFLTDNNEVYVNEVNTIPGFTEISMFPRMWEHSGLNYADLLEKLIDLAMLRFEENKRLKTTFD